MRIFAGMPLGNQTWLDWEISELATEVYSWENHRTKWKKIWVAMLAYRYEEKNKRLPGEIVPRWLSGLLNFV
jgi:hypothetical protein